LSDLAADVLDMAERSIRHSGAGSEGFRVAVTWAPAELPGLGMAIAWILLITLPSHMLGAPPLGVTSSPVISPSVPREHEVAAAVASALPQLRAAREKQDHQAMSSVRAALRSSA
jgi:hypothetical protein